MESSSLQHSDVKCQQPRVLVVDDEEGIRRTLQGILSDEGYLCFLASGGEEALAILQREQIALTLLDIWMPGMDGMETLGRIKESYPDLPVIMISGHASIQTAVQATQLGAVDFIEKPLDLLTTLQAVSKALDCKKGSEADLETTAGDDGELLKTDLRQRILKQIDPIVFRDQKLPGAAIPQKTIARASILYGLGVHTGQKSGLALEPLPANSGIHFVGVHGRDPVAAHLDFVKSTGFATTLRKGDTSVSTIEHLMSAFHAYGISNVLVKCNGEVPVMDGSSLEFCKLIEDIGVEEQAGAWHPIEIKETIRVGKGEEYIELIPADEFSVDYTLKYPEPVGEQHMYFKLGDIEAYKREIAPARTFGFVKDIDALQQAGLAQGGRFNNFVLMGDKGPVNGALRFPDEPVRHKILDAIGDLYLLGRPIKGRVVAKMTGHSDNIALLQALREKLEAAT